MEDLPSAAGRRRPNGVDARSRRAPSPSPQMNWLFISAQQIHYLVDEVILEIQKQLGIVLTKKYLSEGDIRTLVGSVKKH